MISLRGSSLINLNDLTPSEAPKALVALARFRFQVITDPDDPAFHAAYDLLDSFFAPRGELEEREVLAGFVREGRIDYGSDAEGNYRMVAVWEGEQLVAVRDCYIDVDLRNRVSLAALSHAFIAEPWRRSGLAAVLRAMPAQLAREVVARRFSDPDSVPKLVVAEMEPVESDNLDTLVRLVAYGRSGFSVLDPRRVPYSQPDLREALPADAGFTGHPLFGVVRWIDHPEARSVPVALAAAFPRLFHMTHHLILPRERVAPSEEHALRTLAQSADEVPLLPLPTGRHELERLRPLMRGELLKLYPPGLRGPARGVEEEDDLARLREAWGS